MPFTLLYLHGFNSSPQSQKAQLLRQYVAQQRPHWQFVAPQLPTDVDTAVSLLESTCDAALADGGGLGVVGSSLGGFMATVLAESRQLPAVLINPAVAPHRLLEHLRGPQQNPYTGERYTVGDAHVQALARQNPADSSRGRYLVLLGSADEVLDHRDALAFYPTATMIVEPGDNHALSRFDQHLGRVVDFLTPAP